GSFFINTTKTNNRYKKFFLSEFLPYIKTHFHIIHNHRHQGITKLSINKFKTLRFAFTHPKIFTSINAQSPTLITETPQQINANLHDTKPLARVLGNAFNNPINITH